MRVFDTAIDPDLLTGLRDLAAGDRAFLDDLYAIYLDQADDIIAILRHALAYGDRAHFSAAAHRLASASLNVGALFVAGVCHSIEAAMSDRSARPSASQVEAVEKELDRVVSAVATLAVA